MNLLYMTANRPVQFLRFVKKVHLPQTQDTPRVSQHCEISLTQEINLGDLINLLSKIQIAERSKRKVPAGNQSPLTLMYSDPALQHTIIVGGSGCISHISFVTANRAWVNLYYTTARLKTYLGILAI